jgi:hypothetical protein
MSEDENKSEAGEFKVVDRRRFTEEGDTKAGAADPEPPVAAVSAAAEPAPPVAAPEQEAPAEQAADGAAGGPIDFPSFVLSLATSAQMAMGMISHPQMQGMKKDLRAAQQTVDIIAMLAERTKGNLSAEETKLMDDILYTLRMQYLEAQKAG